MIAVRTFRAASSTCRILPLNRWELSDEESRRSNLTLFTRVGEASQLPERAQGKTRSGGASLGLQSFCSTSEGISPRKFHWIMYTGPGKGEFRALARHPPYQSENRFPNHASTLSESSTLLAPCWITCGGSLHSTRPVRSCTYGRKYRDNRF